MSVEEEVSNNAPSPPYGNPQVAPVRTLGVREKLIILFLLVKILPLILLSSIAWWALKSLGEGTRSISVLDSREALTETAQKKIERLTTDTAQKIAEFLYQRDTDIALLSQVSGRILTQMPEEPEVYAAQFFADFGSRKTGLIRTHGEWVLGNNGMHWVQADPPQEPEGMGGRSVNPENEMEIDGISFNYRAPRGFGDGLRRFEHVPLYSEIALLDLNGMQIAKYIPPDSGKMRFPFSEELLDVSDPKNTYIRAEHYFDALKRLGKEDIYVSDVIGAYVPTHFIGMYTPDYIASRRIDAKIDALAGEGNPRNAETIWKLRVLNAELKDQEEAFNSRQLGNEEIRAEIDRRLGRNQIWKIENKTREETAEELRTLGFPELADEILDIPFEPEKAAFAGAENPKGVRFEGIIRWAKPVLDREGEIAGYVTFALNHAHLSAMIDHITPMPERYTELSNAFDGNYAFIWDYLCRSIVHPRHHSIYGFNPETGMPETPWLERTLYDGMIAAGFDRADWQEYIAALEDYIPWSGDPKSPAFQSRSKEPSPELTMAGLVGLDGRYLNTAPQCTGWMNLTEEGGSGSFYILWSGLYKLTTAAAIPYYTGQYSPEVRGNRRGFGFVAVGAGLDDFSRPAQDISDKLEEIVETNIQYTTIHLIWTTVLLSAAVVVIAVWMASYLSSKLQWLIDGITRFRRGHRDFRFIADMRDEFGQLARSFNDMADNIVHSVHTPLVITDLNLNIIYANVHALMVIGGQTLEEVVGKSYKEKTIYTYGSKCCPITALHDGRKAVVCYLRGFNRYLLGTAHYLTDELGNRRGYIIRSNDVTELALKQIELELANQHQTRFLARMSHELRTPMSAIIGFNEITRSKTEGIQSAEDIQELNDYLARLKSSSFELLNLLNEILEVSNLESGSTVLSEKTVNLTEMLEGIAEKTARDCAQKELTWTTSFDEFTSAHFITDELRLQQVLLNLLSNAVKYTPPSGSVDLIVRQKDRREGKTLIAFTVRDTGCGIPPDQMDSIFRPFEQLQAEGSKFTDGCGLGLPVVRKILSLFGTHIAVQSEVGQGSEFSFELWLKETQKEAPIIPAVVEGVVEGIVEGGRIGERFAGQRALVIDDVRLNRLVLVNFLKESGLMTDEAQDGKEGLEMFERSPVNLYDIVFMDIQMPVMDGWESAMAIRALPRQDALTVPIVTVSANAFPEDIEKSRASGINAHYAKPLQREVLLEILETFCEPTYRVGGEKLAKNTQSPVR